MTENKRFKLIGDNNLELLMQHQLELPIYDYQNNKRLSLSNALDLLNSFNDENEQLKQEIEMLRNGLKSYDEALPLFLSCGEIVQFNSKLFEFEMERMDFYKKYPNRIHYACDDVND